MGDAVFAFVILHYNEPHVTEKSVESVLEHTKNYRVEIVIVDNCSPDGSGAYLEKKYADNGQIHVLHAEKNLGFAKGNNLGYAYAKNILHAEYMCVMNNDVLLLQSDFIERIVQEYEISGCGIIGPHITLLNGYTNYMYLKIHSRRYFENELQLSRRMYRYYTSRLFPIRNMINKTLDKVIPALKFHKPPKEETFEEKIQMVIESKQRHTNIVLHGCCLILTPSYIAKFTDAFDNRTFMFREEELLYLRCRKNNVETVYEPSIDILHLEDMSTNATYKKNQRREAFKFQCQIDSLQILLEELG